MESLFKKQLLQIFFHTLQWITFADPLGCTYPTLEPTALEGSLPALNAVNPFRVMSASMQGEALVLHIPNYFYLSSRNKLAPHWHSKVSLSKQIHPARNLAGQHGPFCLNRSDTSLIIQPYMKGPKGMSPVSCSLLFLF